MPDPTLTSFMAGLILGLSAGLTPGPMFTLVMAQTLKYNVKEGLKVALVPLLSDTPIIWLMWLVSAQLTRFQSVLGVFSLIGGGMLLWLGAESWRTQPLTFKTGQLLPQTAPRSWQRGILLNLLNPHPWLFWLSVGVPMLTKALQEAVWAGVLFVAGFYLLLVGSKVMLVLLLGRARVWLRGPAYARTMRGLGLLLFGFALVLLRDGLRLLQWWE